MKKVKILCLSLVTFIFSMTVYAVDECEYSRQLLREDIQECDQYQNQYQNFSWDIYWVYYPEMNQMRRMCLGAQPDDPPGAHTINFYGRFYLSKCFPDRPKLETDYFVKPRLTCGSIIEAANQVVGEVIPLTGASFNLVYYSNRVVGKKSDYTVKVPTRALLIPAEVIKYRVVLKNEANVTIHNLAYAHDDEYMYTYNWNGLDPNQNEKWAKTKLTVVTSEIFDGAWVPEINSTFYVGSLKAKKLGTGAWLPSVWHFYDDLSKTLYLGDGTIRKNIVPVIDGNYFRIADEKGKAVYYFDNTGKISHTKTALTGTTIFTFAYDSAGRLLTITEPFNRITTFSRFVSGALKAIIAPNGAKASITINSDGYMSKLINPNNETYLMTYDGAGGLLKTFMPPNGDITTLIYDSSGNMISNVHGSGFSSTLTVTANGITNVSAEGKSEVTTIMNSFSEYTKKANGLQYAAYHDLNSDQYSTPSGQQFYYYQNDPRFKTQVQLLQGTNIDNFGNRTTNYTKEVLLNNPGDIYSINKITDKETISNSEKKTVYNGANRETIVETILGRKNKYQVDEYERVIMSQSGEMVAKNYTYTDNLLTKITQGTRKYVLSYYSNDLLKSVRNTLGEITTYTYDAAQRLKTKILPDSRVITYNYDSLGNLTSITPPGKGEHQLNFGINGLISSYNPPLLPGMSNASTTYTYNNDKQLTKVTRPDGEEINFNYHAATGLQTSITGNFPTITKEFAKDLPSQILQDNNSLYQSYYGTVVNNSSYYVNSNPVYEYQRNPTSGAGEKVGSETIKGFGNGSVPRTVNYTYDKDEYLSKAGDLVLTYNLPNNQISQTQLGHIKEFYYYNAFGEIRKYVVKFKSDIIYEYEIQRDGIGRVSKKIEILNSITTTFDYAYDSAGRLIQVSTNGLVSSVYAYDSNSNRVGGNVREEATSAIYDDQDRLVNYNGIIHSYNANGELTNKGSSSFLYDVFGNLKEYTKGNLNINYETDPLQRRSGRIVNGNLTTRFIYNPEGKVVGQLDKNNKLIKTFVYATKAHVPDYYIDQNNNKFKIITDHLGSLRLIVSRSGRVLQLMEHDEFGRILQDTRPGFLPFGFAGGLYDYRTGMIRFGARDYDPETGRWLSKDPIRFNGGDTNLYGYVMADPVNFIDPSGLSISDYLIPWGTGTGGGNIVGGVVGGSIGAGIGVIVGGPVGGYIGGFIGGEIGGAIGGIFDPTMSPDNDRVPHTPNFTPGQQSQIGNFNSWSTINPVNINPNAVNTNGPAITNSCK